METFPALILQMQPKITHSKHKHKQH
uniref:Uncharacterized protein n=1 Tax=Arundo donax TaxID=35708 RepID=A0A0A8Y444_ARUDO